GAAGRTRRWIGPVPRGPRAGVRPSLGAADAPTPATVILPAAAGALSARARREARPHRLTTPPRCGTLAAGSSRGQLQDVVTGDGWRSASRHAIPDGRGRAARPPGTASGRGPAPGRNVSDPGSERSAREPSR